MNEQQPPLEEKPSFEKEIHIKITTKIIMKLVVILLIIGIVGTSVFFSYKQGFKKGFAKGEETGKVVGAKASKEQLQQLSNENFTKGYMEAYNDVFCWSMKKSGYYIIRVREIPPVSFYIGKKGKLAADSPKFSITDITEMMAEQKYFIKGNSVWLYN